MLIVCIYSNQKRSDNLFILTYRINNVYKNIIYSMINIMNQYFKTMNLIVDKLLN